MAHPTLADARELSEWQPPLGVISVYLGFEPGDRGRAWMSRLRSGLDAILRRAEDERQEDRAALRETAARLLGRFEGEGDRPPPHGEAGFVEVARKEGRERWWETGPAPRAAVGFGARPLLSQFVDLCCRGEGAAVALLSAERVRLLGCQANELSEIEEWELNVLSGDWRERKAQRPADPAHTHGVGSSGHDQYRERLEHERHRFLAECGKAVGERCRERGWKELVMFGPRPDAEAFRKGLDPARVEAELGGEADLISVPRGDLVEAVSAAVERLRAGRDRALVERALGERHGGARGTSGPEETLAALSERRVRHLALDPALGEAGEALVAAALAGNAGITIARDGAAELLAPAEGAAAILRY